LPKNAILCVQTDLGSFNVNTSDSVIGAETFIHRKAYDGQKLQLACSLLPANHTKELLIDVGANIGTICISAVKSQLFRRAVAFEPEPNNFRLLRTNVVLNDLESIIELHNIALADEVGLVDLELSDNNHGDHRIRKSKPTTGGRFKESSRKVISVEAELLDSFADLYSHENTMIWIDAQGSEGCILAGARKFIQRRVPLCIEFSPYLLNRSGSYEALLAALVESPYETLIDLDEPTKKLNFSGDVLCNIADRLGSNGDSTDLLFI
jgi:FkbM family methyltransferase